MAGPGQASGHARAGPRAGSAQERCVRRGTCGGYRGSDGCAGRAPLVGSARLWKPRLVFWAGALAIGVISARLRRGWPTRRRRGSRRIAGGGSGALSAARDDAARVRALRLARGAFFPGSEGSGIPQAIAARHLRDDEDRSHFLSLRMVVGQDRPDRRRPRLRRLDRARGADGAGRRLADAAGGADRRHGACARADPRGLGGGHRRGLQHAARRDRLRDRGDGPRL